MSYKKDLEHALKNGKRDMESFFIKYMNKKFLTNYYRNKLAESFQDIFYEMCSKRDLTWTRSFIENNGLKLVKGSKEILINKFKNIPYVNQTGVLRALVINDENKEEILRRFAAVFSMDDGKIISDETFEIYMDNCKDCYIEKDIYDLFKNKIDYCDYILKYVYSSGDDYYINDLIGLGIFFCLI